MAFLSGDNASALTYQVDVFRVNRMSMETGEPLEEGLFIRRPPRCLHNKPPRTTLLYGASAGGEEEVTV